MRARRPELYEMATLRKKLESEPEIAARGVRVVPYEDILIFLAPEGTFATKRVLMSGGRVILISPGGELLTVHHRADFGLPPSQSTG